MTKNNKTYYVKGMHCASCEVLIEKELKKVNGVEKVSVSLKKSCVEVVTNNNEKLDLNKLNNAITEYGYTLHSEKPKELKLSGDDVKKVFVVFLIFIASFYFLERSGLLMRFSVNPNSSAISYFVFGIMAGLSSCAALVGGILLSLSGQWNALYNGNAKKSSKPFVYFNISRLVAFAIFGGLLGLIGSTIKISITYTSFLTLIIALLMLVLGLQMLGIKWFRKFTVKTPKGISKFVSDETNFKGRYMPMVAGALTFFVPCGFTLIAQTNALVSGSVTNGALMLTAFSLGTLPMLGLISFSSIKLYNSASFSKKFNLFSGMLITFFALYTFNAQLNVLGYPSLNDLKNVSAKKQAVKAAEVIGGTQLVQIEAIGFEYYPHKINIKKGIKTRLEIYNAGATGCAQAVYAKDLYPDVIYLKDGLNVVEFTPEKTGTYKISCSMGMVPPVTVYVQ